MSVAQALFGLPTSNWRWRTFGASSESLAPNLGFRLYPRTGRILLTRMRRATRCLQEVSGRSIDSMTRIERRADQLQKPRILNRPAALRSLPPRVIAAVRNLQNP